MVSKIDADANGNELPDIIDPSLFGSKVIDFVLRARSVEATRVVEQGSHIRDDSVSA